MYYVAIATLVVGLIALIVGYRKNNRNTLALSAVLLLIAGAGEDFVSGFQDGLRGANSHAAQASPTEA